MRRQMDFFKKSAIEDGFSYPDFQNEEFDIVYKFDTESLLEYYSGILSLSGLEKKQLWNYLHGKSKPRKAQVEKIEKGLHSLGSELIAISL